MGWLIAALGTGLALGGTLAIYFGAPYIQIEWGYSEVIAGTTALSAGILAVGLAAILFALRDLKRLATLGPGRLPPRTALADADGPGPATVGPAPIAAVEARGQSFQSHDEPALFRPTHDDAPVANQDKAPTVVGRYEANGASYVLFSDGTIEVESDTGTRRYASMQDLRADIERQEAG